MLNLLVNVPLWVFVFCLLGALVTWFWADQFRGQILSDSHTLVRAIALRYLQVLIGLFGIFILGIILSLGSFATNSFRTLGNTPAPTETQTAMPMSTPDSDTLLILPTPVSTEETGITQNIQVPTVSTPTPEPNLPLAAIRTATIGNTGGVGVNLRDASGLDGAVIQIVADGTTVTLGDETQTVGGFTWQSIITPNGQQGWVAVDYLISNE